MTDPRSDHADWDALAVGWALSALDAGDGERFADHLPGCDRCTATVRESLYTVADLAYAVPDEPPPAALKSRLMAAVAAEPRFAPDESAEWPLGAPHPGTPGYDPATDWFARSGPGPAPHAAPGPYGPDRLPGSVDPGAAPRSSGPSESDRLPGSFDPGYEDAFPGPRRPGGQDPGGSAYRAGDRDPDGSASRAAGPPSVDRASGRGRHAASADDVVVPFRPRRDRTRWVTVAAAAAAILALVGGLAVWNVQLRSDRDALQQVVAQREAALAQLTENGPARVAALAPFGKPTDPRQATLVVRGDQVEIIVEGLPETSGDQRYWLWTLRCDTPQPSELRPIRGFQVSQSAFSVRSIGSDPGLASATCFAISREVGSATPTEPREVVLAGEPK